MADILITGATGLLGQRLLSRLSGHHDVVAIARQPPDAVPGVRWIRHDLRNPILPSGLPHRIDVVMHLAQDREFRLFPANALDTFNINVASTALLASWAESSGARQYVFASTGAVYPSSLAPHREDEMLAGCDDVLAYYPATKLAAEQIVNAYRSYFAVTVLRPFFIYGPGQDTRMLLPRLVASLRSGQPILLDGDNGMSFNPLHVSDATEAVVAAVEQQETGPINLAGPEVISLRQAVSVLADALGIEPVFDSRHASRPTNFIADISKMADRLHQPQVHLADVAVELCS